MFGSLRGIAVSSHPIHRAIGERGMTLVAVLMGAVIMSIFMLAAMSSVRHLSNATKALREAGEREDLRRLILTRFDCDRTKAANPNMVNPILLDRASRPVLPVVPNTQSQTLMGWVVTTTQRNPNNTLQIWVERPGQDRQLLFPNSPSVVCLP